MGGGAGDELSVGAVVDACLTPPFLVDRRVVVVREAGRLLTADVPRLVEVVYPLPTTVLVLVAGGGTVPAPLVKAVHAAGRVIDVTTGKAGERKAWLHDHLRGAPVKLEPAAENLLADHVGEDLGRVEGLLGALSAAYGEGARVSADELAPYLGEAGNVPRYELTDAIDKGEPGGPRGPAPHARGRRPRADSGAGHATRPLRQHAGARRGRRRRRARCAAMLGTAPFVAKKAFEQSRRLGSARIAEAINLVAVADLDIRGASGLDAAVVVEILVARLARQTRPARRRASPPRAGRAPLRPQGVRGAASRTTSGGSGGPGRRTRAARSPGRWARCRSGRRRPAPASGRRRRARSRRVRRATVPPRGESISCSAVSWCSQMAASPLRTSACTTVPSSRRCSPPEVKPNAPTRKSWAASMSS